MIRLRTAALVALAATLVGSGLAQADETEGRKRWKHGQELYDQGRYLEAAHEFEAGYAAAPRPLFYLSIGHAYRKAHELAKAKAAYEKLLVLQPDFPGRPEVEGYIASIEDVLQVDPTIGEPAQPAPRAGLAPTPLPPPPAPAAAPTDLAATDSPYPAGSLLPAAPSPPVIELRKTPPPPEAKSGLLRKPWFWVIAGVVVAGGIAIAVIAAQPKSPCPGNFCLAEPPASR